MRRLIFYWVKSPVGKGLRLGQRIMTEISQNLDAPSAYIPKAFARRSRGFQQLERWKATEFRQFLLYTGPVVLKGKLSNTLYNHFMIFYVAIFCLASVDLCTSHADWAQELLVQFVVMAKNLHYFVVYNVHGLIDLSDDVKKFGNLDSFSAFPFENYLRKLKSMVRKPQDPLAQVVRRLSEQHGFIAVQHGAPEEGVPKLNNNGPLPQGVNNCQQFKQVHYKKVLLSVSESNNCVRLRNGQHVLIHNILRFPWSDQVFLVVRHFLQVADFFFPIHVLLHNLV
jgi:hypothetical protein